MSPKRQRRNVALTQCQMNEPWTAVSTFESPSLYHHSAFLAYQNMYLSQKIAHMEQSMRQMQLFAVIGAPPGLSNQHVEHSLDNGLADVDQSSLCSSRRSSSPSSVASRADVVDNCNTIAADIPQNESSSTCNPDRIRTTVIIRNLQGCTRQMLLDFLHQQGFQDKYDLVYLPLYFRNKKCFPFAFVNFLSESVARDFQECANGWADAAMFGDKVADVSWSECQGLQANIDNYRNSSIMHPSVDEEFKPLLFEDGKAVPFPQPTKAITEYRKLRKPKGSSKKN